jgi:hypothetical protein
MKPSTPRGNRPAPARVSDDELMRRARKALTIAKETADEGPLMAVAALQLRNLKRATAALLAVCRRRIENERAGLVVEYLFTLPAVIPTNRVLVHNNVRPTRRLGSRGFRAWLSPAGYQHLVACDCDWAPELGQHYRVERGE